MKLSSLAAAAAVAALAATTAGATTIDFTTYTSPTSVSSIGPVSFSLYGGEAGGAPLVSNYWSEAGYEMNNTPTGGYPTSEGLEIDFAGGANDVSFTFDNYGEGPTLEAAFTGSLLEDAQQIGIESACEISYCTVTVAANDITSLLIDSGYSNGAWAFGIGEITYTPAGVPEPASWALILIGVAGLGAALRTRRRNVLAA